MRLLCKIPRTSGLPGAQDCSPSTSHDFVACQHPERGCFSGPIHTQKSKAFSVLHAKTQIVHSRELLPSQFELLHQVLNEENVGAEIFVSGVKVLVTMFFFSQKVQLSPLLVRLGNQSLNPSLFCRDILVKLPLATFLPTHDDAFNPRSNDPEHSKFNQDEETQVEYNADQEEDKTFTSKHEGMLNNTFLGYKKNSTDSIQRMNENKKKM